MNRAQRRQAAHAKPLSLPPRRRTFGPTRPTIEEVRSSFAEIDHVFGLLRDGEIELHGDTPAFRRDTTGEWFQFSAAMHGWCDLWDRLATHHRLSITTTPVRKLVDQLHAGEMVTKGDIDAAWRIINAARAAYREMDVYEVKIFVRTVMIKDQLEAAGQTGETQ